MRRSASPFLCGRAGGGLVVGHVAVGNGVAGVVQQRGADGGRAWTATVLGGGEPVHGGNDAGVVCCALDGGGHALVRAVLAGASSVEAAVRLLGSAGVSAALLLADASTAVVAAVTRAGEVEVDPVAPQADALNLRATFARLRAIEPPPVEAHVPAAGLVAVLAAGAPATLHLALGPPSCAVFVRHWPGIEVVPEESAGPEGAPLARLAVAVAQATSTDADLRAAARRRLDAVEAAALAEGEAAEQMAVRMDADTDDRGAAVRRLVAQSHAANMARVALEALATPASQASHGASAGPRYDRPPS